MSFSPSWPTLGRVRPSLALCALLSLSLHAHPAAAADEFAVTPAQMQSLGVTVQKLGAPAEIAGQSYPARVTLPPTHELVVSAPVQGMVDQLLVSENDAVRAGQPLLRLVSHEFGELQLKLLEAASKSRLSSKALQRERALLAEGIIPERRVQEAEAAAEEDRARVRQAEAALRLAGFDAAGIKKLAEGGGVQDALVVRAKASGTVLSVDAKPGQRVDPAAALMHIADTSQLWLDVQVPADRRGQVELKGSRIAVVGREVAATPMSIGSTVSDSQTVTLRAKVTQGAQQLRSGEFVQVQVPFAAGPAGSGDAWPVPVQSVVRQADKAYVFVRTPKGFIARQVTVLNSAGQSSHVRGELKAGDEIATGSVIALKAAWLGKSGSN